MVELHKYELLDVVGGFSVTGTIINAFVSAGKFLFDTGRSLGSSFRRIGGNNLCPLK